MERQSRTWLCSVVFLDIVGYTANAVTQQIAMKQRLQDLIADGVADVPKNERIIVDTGDGAALCFLGDPEEALFIALNLRDLIVSQPQEGAFAVRIGINLGPVKVVRSLSGHQNPLGDGINNAQRVMSFAQPNQILVSRSFYDVIACLSQEYARLFSFVGTRRDKHVREHDVYEVKVPDERGAQVSLQQITERVEREREQQDVVALSWDHASLHVAEEQLAQYIGPLAKVLVARTAKQAQSRQEFYDTLAGMIPDEAERARFLTHVAPVTPTAGRSPAEITTRKTQTAGGTTTDAPTGWDPAVLTQIEHGLAVYLGPVSKVLVKKAARKTSDRGELCRLLATEIPSEREQRAFLRAVETLLTAPKR